MAAEGWGEKEICTKGVDDGQKWGEGKVSRSKYYLNVYEHSKVEPKRTTILLIQRYYYAPEIVLKMRIHCLMKLKLNVCVAKVVIVRFRLSFL